MAVTYTTGPMGWHRSVNHERKGAGAKQRIGNTKPTAGDAGNVMRSSEKQFQIIARLDRSTQEVTTSLRKFSTVVLATVAETAIAEKTSDNTQMQKGASMGIKRATSLSESTQSPTKNKKKGARIFGFGKRDKSEEDEKQETKKEKGKDKKQGEEDKEKPIPPFVMGEREAYASANTDPLYPVTKNGWLRDAYVKMLVERVNEENNRALGWDGRCIGKWFGQHLQAQIRHGKIPRNKQAHFLAAVELHRRMSTDPRVPHPNGVPAHTDDLWRDVADALDPAMKYSKGVIMHNAGTLECTLEEFIQDFHRVVVRNDWNTEITTAMFPARSVEQQNGRSGSN